MNQFTRVFSALRGVNAMRPLFEDGVLNVEINSVFKVTIERTLMPNILAWLADRKREIIGDIDLKLKHKKQHPSVASKRVAFDIELKFDGMFEEEKCPSIKDVDAMVDLWWINNWEKYWGKNVVYTITKFVHKAVPVQIGHKWTYRNSITVSLLFLPRGWVKDQSLAEICEKEIEQEDDGMKALVEQAIKPFDEAMDKCMKSRKGEVWFIKWEN